MLTLIHIGCSNLPILLNLKGCHVNRSWRTMMSGILKKLKRAVLPNCFPVTSGITIFGYIFLLPKSMILVQSIAASMACLDLGKQGAGWQVDFVLIIGQQLSLQVWAICLEINHKSYIYSPSLGCLWKISTTQETKHGIFILGSSPLSRTPLESIARIPHNWQICTFFHLGQCWTATQNEYQNIEESSSPQFCLKTTSCEN